METAHTADSDSDYGYDLSLYEEELLSQLVDAIPAPLEEQSSIAIGHRLSTNTPHTSNVSSLRADIDGTFSIDPSGKSPLDDDLGDDLTLHVGRLDPGSPYGHAPGLLARSTRGSGSPFVADQSGSLPSTVENTSRSLPFFNPDTHIRNSDLSRAHARELPDIEDAVTQRAEGNNVTVKEDTRSPLERFRTFPRKAFSVSDLTAGAWCELQYWYTLTRLPFGKKTRTLAMKGGSKVHQDLEDKVHVTVEIEIETKEDAFGLRLWNIIQGLRTLRDTGLTRELEVWGTVDGKVVNGLIDGLSYENPDPEWEEEIRSSQGSQNNNSSEPPKARKQRYNRHRRAEETDLQKITDFFESPNKKAAASPPDKKIYLTDVKTRGSRTLPSGAAIRPSKIQLFLYHRFLSDMAADRLDYVEVFRRYGLNPYEPFSDDFVAQIGSLHDEIFHDPASNASKPAASSGGVPLFPTHPSSPPAPDIIRYTSLHTLVPLLQSELALTFPCGAESLGPLVKVEYRSRGHGGSGESDTAAGEVLGQNIYWVDDAALQLYLNEDMEWWRGERPAKGVPVDEAYKCRSCEFAEDCVWRNEQDGKMLRRTTERMAVEKTRAGAGGAASTSTVKCNSDGGGAKSGMGIRPPDVSRRWSGQSEGSWS